MNKRNEYERLAYRFKNYQKALSRFDEALTQSQAKELSDLEKEGFIQRFEYTLELAWKVMGDWLKSQNVKFRYNTPKQVIRESFQANLIDDGEKWMECLDNRNKTSHTYDSKKAEEIFNEFYVYRKLFHDLHERISSILEDAKNDR